MTNEKSDDSISDAPSPEQIPNPIISRDCPTCGCPSGKNPVEVRSKADVEIASLDSINSFWGGFRNNDFFFDYVRCTSCNLLYNSFYLHPDLVSYAYSEMEDNTSGVPQHLLEKTHRRYVSMTETFGPISGTYLEIGPDIGLTAKIAIDGGKISKLIFIEPNLMVHNDLRRLASDTEIIIQENLQDLISSDLEVEINQLFLIHVLDHLTDPKEDLIKLREKMPVGARLTVVVHNEGSGLRKILGVKWPPFRLQHPQLFSRKTLTNHLESCGFKVCKVKSTYNTFSIRHFLNIGLALIGLSPRWVQKVPNLSITVPLGNIICISEAI
jgi:hypothetical protein